MYMQENSHCWYQGFNLHVHVTVYLSSAVWLFPLVDESFLLAGGVGIAAERNTTGKDRQCTCTVYGIGRHNCEHLHNNYSVNP